MLGRWFMINSFVEVGGTSYNTEDYTLPAEKTFRSAWEVADGNSVVTINIEKAKDVWRNKIRSARIKPLEALDKEFMFALERGESTVEIAAKKQALRDAPALASISAATTEEELTAIQPIPDYVIDKTTPVWDDIQP